MPMPHPAKDSPWTIIGIVVGILLTFAPVFSLFGAVGGMTGALDALSKDGAGNTTELSKHIGSVLVSIGVGVLLSAIGMILLTVSLVLHIKRKRRAILAGIEPQVPSQNGESLP